MLLLRREGHGDGRVGQTVVNAEVDVLDRDDDVDALPAGGLERDEAGSGAEVRAAYECQLQNLGEQ